LLASVRKYLISHRHGRRPEMLRADLAFAAALAVMIGANAYVAPNVGERITMQ